MTEVAERIEIVRTLVEKMNLELKDIGRTVFKMDGVYMSRSQFITVKELYEDYLRSVE